MGQNIIIQPWILSGLGKYISPDLPTLARK